MSIYLTFNYKSEKSSDFYCSLLPKWCLAFSIFFFLFPCKCQCFRTKKGKITNENDDYYIKVLDFAEDYERSNPVLCRKGWKKWLKLVEGIFYIEKKGFAEKEEMERKLKDVIPQNNDYVSHYALNSKEHVKTSGLNLLKSQILSSVSIVIPRNSEQIYLPPEPLDSDYAKNFTSKNP